MNLPRNEPETVVVGRVIRPHGVHGEVVVEVMSDVEDRFSPDAELLMTKDGAEATRVQVVASRPHKGRLLVRFRDFADREAVEELRGRSLEVERSRVPPAKEGSYYFFQIVGCRCRDRQLGDLGEVTDLSEDGGGVLLRVTQGDRELLVPFVQAFVLKIDPEAAVIDVDLPAGLVETCASRS